MSNFRLEDFFVDYPDIKDINGKINNRFQTEITARKEFNELVSRRDDKPPKGNDQLMNNQEFILRYMKNYDSLMLINDPGTGKTRTISAIAEYFKRNRGHIKQAIILVRGKPTKTDIRDQIIKSIQNDPEIEEFIKKKLNTETITNTKGSREHAITKLLKDWYTISTYKSFTNKLRKKYWWSPYSDGVLVPDIDRLRNDYSGSLICIDEFHNIRIDAELTSESIDQGFRKKKMEEKFIQYETLKIFVHNIDYSKLILSSATPMINDVSEIIQPINLMNKADMQLRDDFDFLNATDDELRPYLTGKISYLRALDTGVVTKYQGRPIGDGYQLIVWKEYMNPESIQYKTYYDLTKDNSRQESVYNLQRQASNMVYPDGSVGNDGFNKYIRVNGPNSYSINRDLPDNLAKYFKEPETLLDLSCKYARIMQRILDLEQKDKQGVIFCYGQYVTGSGLIPFSLIIENMEGLQWEQFRETSSIFQTKDKDDSGERKVRIPIKRRYALLTRDTPKATTNVILEVMKSYENRHGDYIRCIIISPIGRDGININNVISIEMIDSEWNRSSSFQAESRGIRATSHIDLLEEFNQKLRAEGIDPNSADAPRLEIDIYRNCSIMKYTDEKGRSSSKSINLAMYVISEDKDRLIHQALRRLKKFAIDVYVNQDRNIRDTDQDDSPECDYQQCSYQGVDPPPKNFDNRSTFDLYYTDKIIEDINKKLVEIFGMIFKLSINQLYKMINHQPKYIDIAIDKLIKSKMPILNRFGFNSYLLEDNGMLFLSYDYPTSSKANFSSVYYVENLMTNLEISLDDVMVNLRKHSQNETVENLKNNIKAIDEDTAINIIDSLDIPTRVSLLEDSILKVSKDNLLTTFDEFILKRYQSIWFKFHEPVEMIIKEEANSKNQKNYKTTQRRLSDKDIEKIKIQTDTPIVYMHIFYGREAKNQQTEYNASSQFYKAEGIIRLLISGIWRDAVQYEIIPYNTLAQIEIARKDKVFRDRAIKLNIPFYGIMLGIDKKYNKTELGDKFKILDIISATNIRNESRGAAPKNKSAAALYLYLLDLGVQSPVDISETNIDSLSEKEKIDILIKKFHLSKDQIKRLTQEDIINFLLWSKTEEKGYRKPDLVVEIYNNLKKKNLVEYT